MGNGNHPNAQGEFRGDFTRDSFDAAKHFSRVLIQQGRVLLDADWNEQTSIVLHYLRSLAADLIGPHGGPADGFKIKDAAVDTGHLTFNALAGRYYVEGILCETEEAVFTAAADFSMLADQSYLVFLDVWERHVTYNEDSDISEIALDGADTATREKVVCRVIVPSPFPDGTSLYDPANLKKKIEALRAAKKSGNKIEEAQAALDSVVAGAQAGLLSLSKATLCARARVGQVPDGACIISPESQYRGAENQLYRVEIQGGGSPWDGTVDPKTQKPTGNADRAATFKWSRDNGSDVFPIRTLHADAVKLTTLGRDASHGLKNGDWVEVVDDDLILQGLPGPLRQVKDIRADETEVTLDAPVTQTYDKESTSHPLLRRWDQTAKAGEPGDGALLFREGTGADDNWIELEDGVQIQFQTGAGNAYRPGDYWLIPARVAIGDVLWPKEKDSAGKMKPVALPPKGIKHYYAPLASISVDTSGKVITPPEDLRRKLAAPAP